MSGGVAVLFGGGMMGCMVSSVVSRSETMLDVWESGDFQTDALLCPFIGVDRAAEWDSMLDVFYGESVRRISCEWAMQAVFHLPMVPAATVNGECVSLRSALSNGGVRLVHHVEGVDTLLVDAWQIGERTWVSKPSRVVLDCLFYSCRNRSSEYVLQAVAVCKLDADGIIKTAEEVGMQDAVRRLASVVSLIKPERRQLWHEEIRDYAKILGGYIIPIWRSSPMFSSFRDFEVDDEFGVMWNFVSKAETLAFINQ